MIVNEKQTNILRYTYRLTNLVTESLHSRQWGRLLCDFLFLTSLVFIYKKCTNYLVVWNFCVNTHTHTHTHTHTLSLSLFFRAYYIYFLLNIKKLVEYFLLILRDFRYVRYYTNYMPPSTAKVRGRYCCVYRQAELHGIMSSACRYVFYPV